MESSVTSCPACDALIPPHHRFCGACGAAARPQAGVAADGDAVAKAAEVSLAKGQPTAVPTPPTPGPIPARKRRYRWPLRVSMIGSILVVAGGAGVMLLGTAIQSAATADATGFGGSLLDTLLASFGLPQIGLGSEGTHTSAAMIAGLVISAAALLLGTVILTVGVLWLLVRMFGGRGDGTFTTGAPSASGGPARRGLAGRDPKPTDSSAPGIAGGSGPGGALTPQEELRYQYERARPKLEAAAKQGRETYKADIAPRLEQGAAQGKKAAAAALARAREARERRNSRP